MKLNLFRWTALLLVIFLSIAASRRATPQVTQPPPLTNTCLITTNVKQLTDFYARILQAKPHASGDTYVEFPTTAGTLAIFDAQAQEKYIPDRRNPHKT